MSSDEADDDLLDLLRKHLGLAPQHGPASTNVLRDAEFVCDNSVDVALSMRGTRAAAAAAWAAMQERGYGAASWRAHELHPDPLSAVSGGERAVEFIFAMDLLNFCFWSERAEAERFSVEYRGRRWTGYWSLVAALRRALDEGIPITSPEYWHSEDFTESVLRNVFRSATAEDIPLLDERLRFMKEAAEVLCKEFDLSVAKLISRADGSAARLVNLLGEHFPCFRDEARFEKRSVRFMKRAQIFAADLWAAFDGEGFGRFDDVDGITMFADYRVPQMLRALGALTYSPPLEDCIKRLELIPPGHGWEVQIRGCSIWCVELMRREIKRLNPDAKVNAILIDFFLYDSAKEIIEPGEDTEMPHHRTRTVWY